MGCILEGRIPPENHRFPTFSIALELIEERNLQTIVETGTSRYGDENCLWDGCSTLIFADCAKHIGGIVYSVDIDGNALEKCRCALDEEREFVSLVKADSVEFLRGFNQPIDFLYLDSYDFEILNPRPSQEHHLKEVMAAEPWLTENAVIMIDDCALPHGGKGKLVIQYLQKQGWKILENNYQVILVRGCN